jgi:hypothetical protein
MNSEERGTQPGSKPIVSPIISIIYESPTEVPSPIPSLLTGPISHHAFPRSDITITQEGGHIDVERGVRLWVCQELLDSGEGGRERVDGTPVLGRQESEANLAGRKGDVRVRNASCEVDCWRGEGVVGRNCDAEVPKAACNSISIGLGLT